MKKFFEYLKNYIKKIYHLFATIYSVIKEGGKCYISSRCFDHSASISFFGILSMIPFFILLVSATGFVLNALGPKYGSVDEIFNIIISNIQKFLPTAGDEVKNKLVNIVSARTEIGFFGIFIMLLAASMVFGAVESALKDIFGIERGRRFLTSKLLFSIFLSGVGFILFIFHYFMTLADSFIIAMKGISLDVWIKANPLIDFFITYIPVPLGFIIVLYYFTPKKMRFSASLSGAMVFLIFWEIARNIYAYYVQNLAKFSILYGSLATPIVLIIWIFYTSNIFLFSTSLVKVIDDRISKGKNLQLFPQKFSFQ